MIKTAHWILGVVVLAITASYVGGVALHLGPGASAGGWPDAAPAEAAPYRAVLQEASAKHGVPLNVLVGMVWAESAFQPTVCSGAGACGLAQLMPDTARGLGVTNINDPAQNVDGGARYLKIQYDRFGTWDLALAAYNAGPGAVQRYNGIPPYSETQSYVARNAEYREILGGAGMSTLQQVNPLRYSADWYRWAQQSTAGSMPKTSRGLGYAADAFDWLAGGTGAAVKPARVDGLNPTFGSRLDRFLAAAAAAGHDISVPEGYGKRTPEEQKVLYDRYKAGKGNLAAFSDGVRCDSEHCFGKAVDLRYGSGAAKAWAHAHAPDFDLAFTVPSEDWHLGLAQ